MSDFNQFGLLNDYSIINLSEKISFKPTLFSFFCLCRNNALKNSDQINHW